MSSNSRNLQQRRESMQQRSTQRRSLASRAGVLVRDGLSSAASRDVRACNRSTRELQVFQAARRMDRARVPRVPRDLSPECLRAAGFDAAPRSRHPRAVRSAGECQLGLSQHVLQHTL